MLRVCAGAGLLMAVLTSCGSPEPPRPLLDASDRRIAEIRHNGVHFSIDTGDSEQDSRWLGIVAPQPVGIPRLPIRMRLRFRDQSQVEGVAVEMLGPGGSGGWVDWRYRFDAQRPVRKADLASVTIWVGDQMFDVV